MCADEFYLGGNVFQFQTRLRGRRGQNVNLDIFLLIYVCMYVWVDDILSWAKLKLDFLIFLKSEIQSGFVIKYLCDVCLQHWALYRALSPERFKPIFFSSYPYRTPALILSWYKMERSASNQINLNRIINCRTEITYYILLISSPAQVNLSHFLQTFE